MITRNHTIELNEYRCTKCGRYWAAERYGNCPMCNRDREDELFQETQRLQRTISQMRGWNTKLKKKIKELEERFNVLR